MQDSEIQAIYERHRAEYADLGLTAEQLVRMAQEVRKQGFAEVYESFDEVGTVGLGIAFRIGNHGMGAISLATLIARLGKDRREALLDLLRRELQDLGLREL